MTEPWPEDGTISRALASRDPHERLLAHCIHALDWLAHAARGALVSPGDPFEFPHFPDSARPVVALLSDPDSQAAWLERPERWGQVRLTQASSNSGLVVVREFLDHQSSSLAVSDWGTSVEGEELRVLWLRADRIPVLDPWGIPTQWTELLRLAPTIEQRFSRWLDEWVQLGVPEILLLGFPIPRVVGGADELIYWQAVSLSQPRLGLVKGYRNNAEGRWHYFRDVTLKKESAIGWLPTQDWGTGRLSSRGQLSLSLRRANALLIGAGALGAPCAEMLVRGGLPRLTVMDGEVLEAGNLLRHTLDITSVGQPKATALARRLSQCLSGARVHAVASGFPPTKDENREPVAEAELVLDCTADETVMRHLEIFPWNTPRVFVSLSVGFEARRLYCFMSRGISFPRQRFQDLFASWSEREERAIQLSEPAQEGVGCWHPVFPARCHEMYLLAAVAVAELNAFMQDGGLCQSFVVYERPDEVGARVTVVHRTESRE